jgi:hypothetical protein
MQNTTTIKLLNIVFIFCSFSTQAQPAIPANFLKEMQTLDSLHVFTPRQILLKAGGMVQQAHPNDSAKHSHTAYLRTVTDFWMSRVENERTRRPLLQPYQQALKNALAITSKTKPCHNFRSSWKILNAKSNVVALQLQNPVNKLSSNTYYSTEMLLGTEAEELLRSINANEQIKIFDLSKDYDLTNKINVPSDTLDVNNNYPIFTKWYRAKKQCRNFYSDGTIAYALYQEPDPAGLGGLHGQLNRGVSRLQLQPSINFVTKLWDWCNSDQNTDPSLKGKDITPDVCNGTEGSFLLVDFCVDPQNNKRLFVALGGINLQKPGKNRVLVSEDAGETWNDYSDGLTELPVNCLLVQKGQTGIKYLGCDDGVYYRIDGMSKWCKLTGAKDSTGLQCTHVIRLTIDYDKGKLIATTYNGSIWVTDLLGTNQVRK